MKFKKTVIPVIIILIGSIINVGLSSYASSEEDGIWLKYKEGMKLVKEKKKKVFIDFHSAWCVFCIKMENETYSDPDIIDYLTENFITIRIKADVEPELAQLYNVIKLPWAWLLDENGGRISQLPGFRTAEDLMPILKFINTDSYKSMSFKKFMEDYEE